MTDDVAEGAKSPEQLVIEATTQELGEWRSHHTTKRFFQFLKRRRMEDLEGLGRGSYSGKSVEETALLQAEVVARAQFIEELLQLDARTLLTIEEGMQNAEYFRL